MAARKKNDDAAQFTVVLEDLNAKFTAFGEALQGFRETTSAEFQSVRAEMRAGFDTTDRKLDAFHDELSLVKTAVIENRRGDPRPLTKPYEPAGPGPREGTS